MDAPKRTITNNNMMCRFGADPELFIVDSKGKVVGSEKVVPKEGIKAAGIYGGDTGAKIVRDGVQLELHPLPSTCRATFCGSIRQLCAKLKETVEKSNGEYQVSFANTVKVTKAELKTLTPESRVLGCNPSLNFYGHRDIGVDPAKFQMRSGGGHLHFSPYHDGKDKYTYSYNNLSLWGENIERLVPIFDVMVAIPSVIIDRDPTNVERRKVYGRAGEYRITPYGIEYRTLSNYWMKSYELMSFVTGLARMGICIRNQALTPSSKWNPENELMSQFNLQEVEEVINTNDLGGAMRIWERVKDFFRTVDDPQGELKAYSPISPTTLDRLDHFMTTTSENGFDYWFDKDPLNHWTNLPDGHGIGFEAFRDGIVATDLRRLMNGYKFVKA